MYSDRDFVAAVKKELARARSLFQGSDASNAALVEEVGELSKALMYEPWHCVFAEAVQVAVMAQRLAVEGDGTMREFRNEKVHQNGRRYGQAAFQMPRHKRAFMPPANVRPRSIRNRTAKPIDKTKIGKTAK